MTNAIPVISFPSPYGVSFILITDYPKVATFGGCEFPSPYGVSFILIFLIKKVYNKNINSFRLLTEYHSFLSSNSSEAFLSISDILVSVSLRSIIHSYELKGYHMLECYIQVSVSLRSIIHSYYEF